MALREVTDYQLTDGHLRDMARQARVDDHLGLNPRYSAKAVVSFGFLAFYVVSVEGSNSGLVSCSEISTQCYWRTHEDPSRAFGFVLCYLLPALCVDSHELCYKAATLANSKVGSCNRIHAFFYRGYFQLVTTASSGSRFARGLRLPLAAVATAATLRVVRLLHSFPCLPWGNT